MKEERERELERERERDREREMKTVTYVPIQESSPKEIDKAAIGIKSQADAFQ